MKSISSLTLILFLACFGRAQTFQSIFDFSADPVGEPPYTQLVQGPGNRLYGETFNGQGNAWGTVFGIEMDGTGFTNVFSFNYEDGAFLEGGLIVSGNTLYGTAKQGGANGLGTVFAVNSDGTDFTNLYDFSGPDGAYPEAGLALSGDTLYGTTYQGGTNDAGTVFAIDTNGTGFTSLYSFGGPDGANPEGSVLVSGSALYGATYAGGTNGEGAVFELQTDGTDFTNLFSFHGYDGYFPQGGLVLSGDMLYGTTLQGGPLGAGNVYGLNTDGSGFTNLYIFSGEDDGANPPAGLVLYGNTLYGTTSGGGLYDFGTVFAINTDGTDFTNLYDFTGGLDGGAPGVALLLSSNTLYSTTLHGGTNSDGTIFSLTPPLPPPPPPSPPGLAIQVSTSNVVVTWSATATGFTLLSTTNLTYPPAGSAVTNLPVIVNGLYTVTNPINSLQMFYYLSN
ncbi:MAG: choice-of-anchor tandem repeat GloVer-containing protein [Verrucomicrobiota bacterium]